MSFEPILPCAHLGDKRHSELSNTLHRFTNYAFDSLTLGGYQIDNHLIVHLQNHLRLQALGSQAAANLDHRQLHYIGCAEQ